MTNNNGDKVWRALADPQRRRILDELAAGPLTTGDMVARFDDLCRTAVMKHLDILTDANLVLVRREGRYRYNYLNPVPIEQVCQRWVNQHVRSLASALNRLKEVTEAELPSMKETEEKHADHTSRGSKRRSVRT